MKFNCARNLTVDSIRNLTFVGIDKSHGNLAGKDFAITVGGDMYQVIYLIVLRSSLYRKLISLCKLIESLDFTES